MPGAGCQGFPGLGLAGRERGAVGVGGRRLALVIREGAARPSAHSRKRFSSQVWAQRLLSGKVRRGSKGLFRSPFPVAGFEGLQAKIQSLSLIG